MYKLTVSKDKAPSMYSKYESLDCELSLAMSHISDKALIAY